MANESTPPPLHGVLQKLRAYDRYKLAHPELKSVLTPPPEPKKPGEEPAEAKPPQSANPTIDRAQALLDRIMGADRPKRHPSTPLTEQLQQEYHKLLHDAGVESSGDPELRDKHVQESHSRMVAYAFNRKAMLREVDGIQLQINELDRKAKENPNTVSPKTIEDRLTLIEQQRELQGVLRDYMPYVNPEAFAMHELFQLREFKRQFEKLGIVTTETLAAQDREIKDKLISNRFVALLGETGTGKTQAAKRIATERFYETHPDAKPGDGEAPYYLVMGHKFTSKEDLISYLGYTAESRPPEDTATAIKEAQDRFREMHADYTAEEMQSGLEDVRQIYLGREANNQVLLKEYYGPIIKAAAEGKVCIVDEFNYIDPGLLAFRNELVQAKPGQTITTPDGTTITVREGFGIIDTGNVTQAGVQRYLNRHQVDEAAINRLNSAIIIYNAPPMEDVDTAFAGAGITDLQRKEGHRPKKRELYQVGLAVLVDRKGNLYGPEDTLDESWRMTQAFKLFQNNFAGGEIRPGDRMNRTVDVRLEKTHASMRTFTNILSTWKSEGFRYPLEYYLYEKLIKPAAAVEPREAAYYFYTLKNKYSFFQGPEWTDAVMEIDPNTNRIKMGETVDKLKLEKNVRYKLFTTQEVTEAFAGIQTPQTIQTTETQTATTPALSPEQVRVKAAEWQTKIDQMKVFRDEFPKSLELFCADEAAIMPPPQAA